MDRPLSPEEAALWARVLQTVRPMRVAPKPTAVPKPVPVAPVKAVTMSGVSSAARAITGGPGADRFQKLVDLGVGGIRSPRRADVPAHRVSSSKGDDGAANTLDGGWDRKLARGLVSPDHVIDLHGHNLSTAYATLDAALEQSIRMGDRVVLLVTGNPPKADAERSHGSYRGAIRAAVGDWLAGSRHAAAIAAVRGAHPRHGGAGALYIILRRRDPARFY